jgi:hypothetical protein
MKFPVWQTTLGAFEYCWRERAILARFGALPLAVMVAASFAVQAAGFNQTQNMTAQSILAIVQLIVYLPLGVTWFRLIVFGGSEAARRPIFTLGRLEGRMLWWQVLTTLLFAAIGIFGALVIYGAYNVTLLSGSNVAAIAVAVTLSVLLLLALSLIATRLSMVLVLAALDKPVGFKVAWRMTEGVGWQLLGASGLVGLAAVGLAALFKLFGFLVGAIGVMSAGGSLGAVLPYVDLLGAGLATFVFTVGFATVFGIAYKALIAAAPAEPAVAPDAAL